MSWRQRLISLAGPSILPGIRLQEWMRLLADNRFAVHPRFLPRAVTVTGLSAANSLVDLAEMLVYGHRLAEVDVPAPLFVLGHWRSGTTFLHQLLAQDEQFAAPTVADVLFPCGSLSVNGWLTSAVGPFLPRRRPSDRMNLDMNAPYEDEFALCGRSLCSAQLSMVFPCREANYDRYVTMCEAPSNDVVLWQRTLVWFLRKLTLKYAKPLVLKSPAHTGRVRLLLELFPEARFVHVSRNPFEVFTSTRRTMRRSLAYQQLQTRPSMDFVPRVLRQYCGLYEAYFHDRDRIPDGRLVELKLEDVVRDPLDQLERLYRSLALDGFETARGRMAAWLERATEGREPAGADSLTPEEVRQIVSLWSRGFEEWGYSTDCPVVPLDF